MSRTEMFTSFANAEIATSTFMARMAESTEVPRPHCPVKATIATNARRMPKPAKSLFPMVICCNMFLSFSVFSDFDGGDFVHRFDCLLNLDRRKDAVDVEDEHEPAVELPHAGEVVDADAGAERRRRVDGVVGDVDDFGDGGRDDADGEQLVVRTRL